MSEKIVDPIATRGRPKVKLEEMPRGRGLSIMLACYLIGAMGVIALALGGLKATGVLVQPRAEAVWLAYQKDALDQSYDQYVDDYNRKNAVSGTILMAVFTPVYLGLAVFLWYGSIAEAKKCPKGHVTYKTYSYCPECGNAVWAKDELSPDEWKKRYGEGGGPIT